MSYKIACAPSEYSDQSISLRMLIRVFANYLKALCKYTGIDIFVESGGRVFQETVSIPMGTNVPKCWPISFILV